MSQTLDTRTILDVADYSKTRSQYGSDARVLISVEQGDLVWHIHTRKHEFKWDDYDPMHEARTTPDKINEPREEVEIYTIRQIPQIQKNEYFKSNALADSLVLSYGEFKHNCLMATGIAFASFIFGMAPSMLMHYTLLSVITLLVTVIVERAELVKRVLQQIYYLLAIIAINQLTQIADLPMISISRNSYNAGNGIAVIFAFMNALTIIEMARKIDIKLPSFIKKMFKLN